MNLSFFIVDSSEKKKKNKVKLNKSTEALCTKEHAVIIIHIETWEMKVQRVSSFPFLFFFFFGQHEQQCVTVKGLFIS